MQKLIVLFFALTTLVFGTTLTGTIKGPDGTGITGALFMSLSQQGALQTSGSCGTTPPSTGTTAEVVPTYQIRIALTAGSLVSPPSIFGNDCMLPSGTFYNVRITDNNSNVLMTDRWLITGTTIDLGTIVSVVISGTTGTLGGAAVLTNPAGNQTITQPPLSWIFVNNLQVTSDLRFAGQFECLTTGCTFGSGTAFNGGINVLNGTNSNIPVGLNGNFYNRVMNVTSDPSCAGFTGATNGWTAIRDDSTNNIHQFDICAGNALYTVPFAVNGVLSSLTGLVMATPGQLISLDPAAGSSFSSGVRFDGGINIPAGASQSNIFIGPLGNFYDRTFSGSLPGGACSGIADGWMAVQTDTPTITVCIGGNPFGIALVAQ